MKITAAAITEMGKIRFMELDTPPLSGKEVLVKMHAAALCTLEQRIFRGDVKMPFPCIGGHEFAGEAIQLGPDVDSSVWKVGQRVAVRLLYSCGECHQCRSGHSNMCENARHKPVRKGLLPGPGGLCDCIIADSSSLFPIPDSLSYECASLTEPLACVVHSVNLARIALAEDVIVIGGGIMGQMHCMLSKLRGARVLVSEPDSARRELAMKNGADGVLNPFACDILSEVRNFTSGRGADVVFNTVPKPDAFREAVSLAAKAGRVIQYTSVHPDEPVAVSPQFIHNRQVSVIGSISPEVQDFYTANRLLASSLVDVSDLIHKTFPFRDSQLAFEEAVKAGSFRVIVTD